MPTPARQDAREHPIHDVLVVGGGLVGASLAIALDRLGLDVGMVEAAPAGALPGVFDQRNLSFAEATVNALEALAVMPLLRAPSGAIRRIHISRAGDFGRIRLDAHEHGRDEFGRVVVARDFGEALETRLSQLQRLTRYRPARFIGLGDGGGDRHRMVRVADDAGERGIGARLLVAADGNRSAVRAALGIAAREAGLEVLGISLVTNAAAGISPTPLEHAEVIAAGKAAEPRLRGLLAGLLERL